MKLKLSFVLIIIAIIVATLFGIDKATSQNSQDSALIHIGLSDRDSSSCSMCMEGGAGFLSGCKRCIQDGVIFSTDVANENPYYLAWSNDDGMYYGDDKCDGVIKFPNTTSSSGDTYWVELTKHGKVITSSLYSDKDFTQLSDFVTTTMCSEPTDLRYFRISTEDGKDPGYGGRILGYIDDISLYQTNIDSSQHDISIIDNFSLIFEEDFENCSSKTCADLWTLQDPDMLYVDINNNNFHIDSQATKSNDYAHFDLGDPIIDSWILRFKLHIEELDKNPQGKGIFQLDPTVRQILFGIPALVLPTTVLLLSKNQQNKKLSSLIILDGVIIFFGILSNLVINYQINNPLAIVSNYLGLVLIFSIFVISLGIFSLFKSRKS